jgi:hypothetical protein
MIGLGTMSQRLVTIAPATRRSFTAAWLFTLAACGDYGSVASLATPDVRVPPAEFLGTWGAPADLRCRNADQSEGTRFALPFHVFTVDTTPAGELRMVGRPDRSCEVPAADSVEFRGAVVQLDDRRFLEFRKAGQTGSATAPLFQWMRLGVQGDTVFFEPLSGDSLGAWLARSPKVTPHRISGAKSGAPGQGDVVLTGNAAQLKTFVRQAFENPAVRFEDTLLFVRERPERRGLPRS